MKKILSLICLFVLASVSSQAQINHNTCKFLGNITTYGKIEPDAGDLTFEGLWDQLTCENESKWGNIVTCTVSSAAEGVEKWNWRACDAHYQWSRDHGVLFKFKALLWTYDFPSCLKNVKGNELKKQVEYWFDAVAIKYPDVAIIDVVNEAIKGHAESDFKNSLRSALGSSNSDDYTWVVEAFNMARQRFPNAVLVYNDYNTLTHQKSEFVALVSYLVQQGAPIDAYGHQAHDLEEYYSQHGNSMSGFENNLKDIHNQITQKGGRELQCYITELDISQANDNTQLDIMRGSFPAMWEAEFVSGITLWGYVNGKTWSANAGLVTSTGEDRPSMTWLRQYMATDIAKGVSANFCGKDAGNPTITLSVYTEFDESTGTLTYYYDDKRSERTGPTELYDPINTPDAVRFTGYYANVLKAVIDPSMKNAPLTSFRNMFYGNMDTSFKLHELTNMTSIEGLENLNTDDVTNMRNMFGSCYSLTTLDLSSFNTAKVTNMQGMFTSCHCLTSVDVSSFDISSVTEMSTMFIDCPALKTIYCSNDWSTSTAQSDYMFYGCKSLVGGKGTVFDSNVINATYARPDGGTCAPGYFTEKPAYLVGDANGNGEVEIGDVTSVLTLMATPEANGYNNQAADANGNGEIEIGDVTTILTIMAGGGE